LEEKFKELYNNYEKLLYTVVSVGLETVH